MAPLSSGFCMSLWRCFQGKEIVLWVSLLVRRRGFSGRRKTRKGGGERERESVCLVDGTWKEMNEWMNEWIGLFLLPERERERNICKSKRKKKKKRDRQRGLWWSSRWFYSHGGPWWTRQCLLFTTAAPPSTLLSFFPPLFQISNSYIQITVLYRKNIHVLIRCVHTAKWRGLNKEQSAWCPRVQ